MKRNKGILLMGVCCIGLLSGRAYADMCSDVSTTDLFGYCFGFWDCTGYVKGKAGDCNAAGNGGTPTSTKLSDKALECCGLTKGDNAACSNVSTVDEDGEVIKSTVMTCFPKPMVTTPADCPPPPPPMSPPPDPSKTLPATCSQCCSAQVFFTFGAGLKFGPGDLYEIQGMVGLQGSCGAKLVDRQSCTPGDKDTAKNGSGKYVNANGSALPMIGFLGTVSGKLITPTVGGGVSLAAGCIRQAPPKQGYKTVSDQCGES